MLRAETTPRGLKRLSHAPSFPLHPLSGLHDVAMALGSDVIRISVPAPKRRLLGCKHFHWEERVRTHNDTSGDLGLKYDWKPFGGRETMDIYATHR